MKHVTMVAPENVAPMWHSVEFILKPALDWGGGTFDIEDVRRECIAGTNLLWIGCDATIEAATVVKITEYPRKRVLTVLWAGCIGGDGLRWAGLFDGALTKFAKAHGCVAMEAYGREGWIRAGGMKETGRILRKDIM